MLRFFWSRGRYLASSAAVDIPETLLGKINHCRQRFEKLEQKVYSNNLSFIGAVIHEDSKDSSMENFQEMRKDFQSIHRAMALLAVEGHLVQKELTDLYRSAVDGSDGFEMAERGMKFYLRSFTMDESRRTKVEKLLFLVQKIRSLATEATEISQELSDG